MRALVISDTHFGAWTGEDLLRHDRELALLAPHLDDVDEVIFLGDLFDHDHHLIVQEAAELLALELITDEPPDRPGEQVPHELWFRRLLEHRLEGVQIELRYPIYRFGAVLCTHGHYLDYRAHRHGSFANRVLGRTLWSIASGGARTSTPSIEDYESVVTLLTELLYTIARMEVSTESDPGQPRRAFCCSEPASCIGPGGTRPRRRSWPCWAAT